MRWNQSDNTLRLVNSIHLNFTTDTMRTVESERTETPYQWAHRVGQWEKQLYVFEHLISSYYLKGSKRILFAVNAQLELQHENFTRNIL